jgi:hypothetical protein
MPLARSPMSKSGGREMTKYQKSVNAQLDSLTPWINSRKYNRERLKRMGVKEGEVVVLLDPGDSKDDPLFKDSKVLRRDR